MDENGTHTTLKNGDLRYGFSLFCPNYLLAVYGHTRISITWIPTATWRTAPGQHAGVPAESLPGQHSTGFLAALCLGSCVAGDVSQFLGLC